MNITLRNAVWAARRSRRIVYIAQRDAQVHDIERMPLSACSGGPTCNRLVKTKSAVYFVVAIVVVLAALAIGALVGPRLNARSHAAQSSPHGVKINVMNSGGFAHASKALAPEFERATHNELSMSFGPSIGTAPDAIPVRIARGEPVDVVIVIASVLVDLTEQGKVVKGSRVDIAQSRIGMAVRAGQPKPDIGSADAVRRALLEAKSIAYSDSVSGAYVRTELFERLGIAGQISSKCKEIRAEEVGNAIARGDAEIGFHQVSELLAVSGIDYVGPLPSELQKITVFSAGISVDAKEPEAAKALIQFFASEGALSAIAKSGLEPFHP